MAMHMASQAQVHAVHSQEHAEERQWLIIRTSPVQVVSGNKKTGQVTPPGGRFLALYLTWRQEAAKHHGKHLLGAL
jgi:hypothetical protein